MTCSIVTSSMVFVMEVEQNNVDLVAYPVVIIAPIIRDFSKRS